MRTISTCRACESENLTEILDLGEQYVSDFREDDSKPNKYPLIAVICEDCMLVQLRHTTPSGDMYHENYGFKSGISDSIKDDLRSVVLDGLRHKPAARSWLDIASNDGTLLSYVHKPIYRVGVDPITKLCKEATQHADLIVNDFFQAGDFVSYDTPDSSAMYQQFDVITSISCFYDMDRPNEFVGDVAKVLGKQGVWIIQQNYLLPTMQLHAVDNFCHEHLEYYTLLSLEKLLDRHDLEVIEVSTSMVNGGSIRTVVAKKGVYDIDASVREQREIERAAGLHTLEPYQTFGAGVIQQLADLEQLVKGLVADGKTVYILAASTRGATIWQGANLDSSIIPYAIERNPAKVGKYFSALGIPICSEEYARIHRPDYLLIGPWFFGTEVLNREQEALSVGVKAIMPLPELKILGYDDVFRAENS